MSDCFSLNFHPRIPNVETQKMRDLIYDRLERLEKCPMSVVKGQL